MTQRSLLNHLTEYLIDLRRTIDAIPVDQIEAIGEVLFSVYLRKKQVFVIGNGGSAATASHMACDLGKNTIAPNRERFRIMSLTDNMPLVSALANDIGYDQVFAEQLLNLVQPGDVLVVLSGSGRSKNVVEAMKYARHRGATVVALLGFDGGEALSLADKSIVIPSSDYGVIEDMHGILNHILTRYFTDRLASDPSSV